MTILRPEEFTAKKLDYVIVGGGTAGLVVAARLSEDPRFNVGVIEAGEFVSDHPSINIPGMCGSGIGNSSIDWCYKTVPQQNLGGRILDQNRGKMLGGCSGINFLKSGRGCAEEYDVLEELGNPGWNWQQMLSYFRKSETFAEPDPSYAQLYGIDLDPNAHGTNGPLKNSYPKFVSNEIREPLVKAMEKLGVKNNPDPACGNNIGASCASGSVDPETLTRSYSTSAYYLPNRHRKNLFVLTGATVTKVLLKRDRPQKSDIFEAAGVELIVDGVTYMIEVSKEVILCAGALKTPQILELSGIGRSDVLNKCGIEQFIDLPGVGENLRKSIDHLFVTYTYEVLPHLPSLNPLNSPESFQKELLLYNTKGDGHLSSLRPFFSFIPLRYFSGEDQIDKMKRSLPESGRGATVNRAKQMKVIRRWFDSESHAQVEIFQAPRLCPGVAIPPGNEKYQTLVISSMHPFSRGTVHIASSDALAMPEIDPGYLREEVDLKILVEALKFVKRITETNPLASLVVKPIKPDFEVLNDQESGELERFVKNEALSVFHQVGSASMLPQEHGGVVDHTLVVYGTKNLRVIDASILPLELSSHIQTTVYALAEKGADLVKSAQAYPSNMNWEPVEKAVSVKGIIESRL